MFASFRNTATGPCPEAMAEGGPQGQEAAAFAWAVSLGRSSASWATFSWPLGIQEMKSQLWAHSGGSNQVGQRHSTRTFSRTVVSTHLGEGRLCSWEGLTPAAWPTRHPLQGHRKLPGTPELPALSHCPRSRTVPPSGPPPEGLGACASLRLTPGPVFKSLPPPC